MSSAACDTEESASQLLVTESDLPATLEKGPRRWQRPLAGGVLGVAAVLAVAALVCIAQMKRSLETSKSVRSVGFISAVLLEEQKCAKKEVEDCSKSQCCEDLGYQCYAKSEGWAVCKEACDPKEMKKYDPDHEEWECKKLGERARCAQKDVEDCSKSQCCADLGYQCYAKSDGWAVCKEACDPEEMKKYDPDHEEWECTELGERTRCAKDGEECASHGCCETPGTVCYEKDDSWSACMTGCDATAMQENDPKKEAWSCKETGERNYKSTCSWAGQECSKTKCCSNNGFACVVKDEIFTGCRMTQKKSTWFTQEVPLPADWEGTVLGGYRGEYAVDPVPPGLPIQGNSLFCVMVYLPNSTEESLMWLAKKNGVGIFGCNESMTFHSWKSAGADWDTGETTLVNTDVFLNAFEQIREAGRYQKFDWTVKSDPDCVFFADRLMGHLWALRAPPFVPVYLKNNGMDKGLGNNGFLGAIEIFSTAAMKVFFANKEECKKYLGVDSGEDGFFKGCMDATGVGFMTDTHIFAPDYDPAVCRKQERVAFHPIKTYKEFQCCVDIVMGKKRNPVYGKCDDDDSKIERPWFHEKA